MDEINDKLISVKRLIQFWKKFRVGESYLKDRNKGEVFNNYTENNADGAYSHAEGSSTTASGNYSHAEGFNTEASREYSHAEGNSTIASGISSHAEGSSTTASGDYSHAEGFNTVAIGISSHAEGGNTIANEEYSHAEGINTIANKKGTHAEGGYIAADGLYSHAEGVGYSTTSIISGEANSLTYAFDTPFTGRTQFVKYVSYNDKIVEIISIDNDILEVKETLSDIPLSGASIYIFGGAIGEASHVEGISNFATGIASHAEGSDTLSSGDYSHAEGFKTESSGDYSHSEGYHTMASGISSHAEGFNTLASGDYSHAEGYNTTASGEYSHAEGKYNIIDNNHQYAHIIGNGTDVNARSNAHTVDWDGNAWYKGKIYIGGSSQDDGLELTGTTVNYFESASLTTTWSNSVAPFTQVVQINGILPNDTPIVDIKYSGTYTNDKIYDEEWGKIYRVVPDENQLTFYAHEKTTEAIPIKIMVVRQNG